MRTYPDGIVWPLENPKCLGFRNGDIMGVSFKQILNDLKSEDLSELRFVLSYTHCYYECDYPDVVICKRESPTNNNYNTIWPLNRVYEFYNDVYTVSLDRIINDLTRDGYFYEDYEYLFFNVIYSNNPTITIYDKRIKQ